MLVSQEADPLDLELDPLEEEQIDSALELRMRMEKEIAENNVLVQPISWEDAGEVLKYNVVIQRRSERPEANGRYSYTEVYRHETNEEETEECTVFLDPILPAGNYRLTIQVYNVLGMLEEDYTSTEDFIILEAHLPEVKRVSYPLNSGDTIYLDDGDNNGIIRATGKNFLSIQEGEEDLSYMDYTLSNDKRTLKAKEIVSLKQDGSEIEVHFDERSMDVGVYNFTATDASGLHSIPDKNSVITVKFKKLIDLDVSGGYMCPVIIFDDTVKTYMDTRLWPVSLVGKLTFIPYKQLWGYLGIGLSVFGTRYFGSGTTATYTLDGNFFNAQLNLVYQKPIYFKNK
ncbi:MAG: hypothetical protein J6W60_03340, partial [Treponema sp.]|nr:hypothetical protein [Treponema sp.]